jgi:DNA-binding transcriptional MerR regulator
MADELELEKSPGAFRTISEVAEELQIPQHVLRFWETKFSQIRPLKRGGNRRYYRPDDVDLLRAINHLLYVDGYTIRGVQKLLKENGPRGLAIQVQDRDTSGQTSTGQTKRSEPRMSQPTFDRLDREIDRSDVDEIDAADIGQPPFEQVEMTVPEPIELPSLRSRADVFGTAAEPARTPVIPSAAPGRGEIRGNVLQRAQEDMAPQHVAAPSSPTVQGPLGLPPETLVELKHIRAMLSRALSLPG